MQTNTDNSVLQRVTLKNLTPTIFNGLIVGVIIAKQDAKHFAESNVENGGARAVINFTFRDSPQDFINVTYWGTSQLIMDVDKNFHVGDVIELLKPQIKVRQCNDNGEQFRPMVTSPYFLTLSDISSILHHDGPNIYENLLRLPTKPPGFVPIRDIHNGGLAIKSTFVDILGAVAYVGKERAVKLKTGTEAQVLEVILFDQTHQGIRVSIWNTECIKKASNWQPRTTILFITDAKVDWSAFHKSTVATFSFKSILTENPIGREAENLGRYALTAPLKPMESVEQFAVNLPDVAQIQNVMSVQQVLNRLDLANDPEMTSTLQFTALIYAVVTQLDLDGLGRLLNKKCGHCKTLIKTGNVSGICDNPVCPVAQKSEFVEPDISFDIRMSISDHTGTLTDCRLSGKSAEDILGCSAQTFVTMSDDDKTNMKWKYLLERCAIRLIVYVEKNRRPILSVLGCYVADMLEVAENIPVY